MRKQQRRGAVQWPEGAGWDFLDRDARGRFEDEWAQIARRGPALVDVLAILRVARAHADLEKKTQERLNQFAPDLTERTERIERLLAGLRKEMDQLSRQKWLQEALILSQTRAFQADSQGETAASSPTSGELLSHPTALQVYLEQAQRSRVELHVFLRNFLKQIERPVRRHKGRQGKPWIPRAMLDLRKLGLTKVEADALLRAAGLKGSDEAEAAQ